MSEEEQPISPEGEEPEFDFGEKKKKKDKKEKKEKKEKKSKKEKLLSMIEEDEEDEHRGLVYPYEQLLKRVHDTISASNPALANKKRVMVKPPEVVRVGSKRVGFTNFAQICEMMGRSQDHVYQFILAELGTTGSLTGDQKMILKGRYTPKHVEGLLRKYMTEFVVCPMCKSMSTDIAKDQGTRLWQLSCRNCGAGKTVNAIKSGFHATLRGDRKAAKAALR